MTKARSSSVSGSGSSLSSSSSSSSSSFPKAKSTTAPVVIPLSTPSSHVAPSTGLAGVDASRPLVLPAPIRTTGLLTHTPSSVTAASTTSSRHISLDPPLTPAYTPTSKDRPARIMLGQPRRSLALQSPASPSSAVHREGFLDELTWSTTPFTSDPLAQARLLQVLNILSFIAMVVINILVWARVFAGRDHRYIVQTFPTLISPPNYAFGIWVVIYFFAGLFCLYQALPGQRQNPLLFAPRGVFVFFILANLFNIAWNLFWVYAFLWTAMAMALVMVLCLAAAYTLVRVGRKQGREVSVQEYLALHLPLAIYLSWASYLFAVALATALRWGADWTGEPWEASGWAVLVLCVLAAVTLLLLAFRTDWAYAAMMSWAFLTLSHRLHHSWKIGRSNVGDDLSQNYDPDPARIVFLAAVILGSIMAFLGLLAVAFKVVLWEKDRREYLLSAPKVAVIRP